MSFGGKVLAGKQKEFGGKPRGGKDLAGNQRCATCDVNFLDANLLVSTLSPPFVGEFSFSSNSFSEQRDPYRWMNFEFSNVRLGGWWGT